MQQEFLAAAQLLSPAELEEFVREHVMNELREIRRLPALAERSKCFKELCMEWHPDKCPAIERLATSVFQMLQSEKESVLAAGTGRRSGSSS